MLLPVLISIFFPSLFLFSSPRLSIFLSLFGRFDVINEDLQEVNHFITSYGECDRMVF